MGDVEQMLRGLHGRKHNRILCQVVKAGLCHMPGEPSIGPLCAEVGDRTGKRNGAVYKALARTVHDIWEHGDRKELQRLMGYRLTEVEPPVKEVVTALITTLWSQSVRLEYRLQEGGLDRRVGISCRMTDLRTGEETMAVMPPFSRDRAAVTALSERWTREQLPLEQFRDMVLLDQLRER